MNKHAPLKKKFLGTNHAPYITKTLWKAIMHRSEFETKYLKTETENDLKLYKNIKTLLVSYPKGKEIIIVIIYEKRFGQ